MNISEGKYKFYDESTFFQKELYVKSKNKDTSLSIEQPTFDVVSAIFYFRRYDWSKLKVNDVVEIPTFYGDKPFPMLIVYKGIEEVSIGSSTYRCRKFTPVMDPGKIFKKKEDMTIWFSDDKNRIPVSMKFNLHVGAYRVELESYDNLLYPLEAKVK